jgi:hypothetical protein
MEIQSNLGNTAGEVTMINEVASSRHNEIFSKNKTCPSPISRPNEDADQQDRHFASSTNGVLATIELTSGRICGMLVD